MNKKSINIIVVETSHIIYEGLLSVLTKTGQLYNIQLTNTISELQQVNLRTKVDLIFINPILIQNQLKEFQSLKKEFDSTLWLGIVYTFFDQFILAEFDETVSINDSPEKITSSIERLLIAHQKTNHATTQQETLSDRETDVLKLLVEGNANKEIADKLNISPHTVISHRKNISQKIGIKSVAGLTIYAVVNNIVSIDKFRD